MGVEMVEAAANIKAKNKPRRMISSELRFRKLFQFSLHHPIISSSMTARTKL